MKSWAGILLAALLSTGCAAEATETTSVSTRAPVPTLAVSGWEGMAVETICLVGSEVYEGVPESHRPIMDGVAHAIDADQRDHVAARVGSTDCDVTITFDLTGQPFAEWYSGGVGGNLYTGAAVEGTITLSAEGYGSMTVDLTNRTDPPESFMLPEWQEPPRDPGDAPFWRTVREGICGAFAGWFEGTELTDLLIGVRGSWPPRGDDCGGYGEQSNPFLNLDP